VLVGKSDGPSYPNVLSFSVPFWRKGGRVCFYK
jgi:hypothetical protein